MQKFLAITCITTRGEFDVINVQAVASLSETQAAHEFAYDLENVLAIRMYNNVTAIIEDDGETFTLVVTDLEQFMNALAADADLEYDESYTREHVQIFINAL